MSGTQQPPRGSAGGACVPGRHFRAIRFGVHHPILKRSIWLHPTLKNLTLSERRRRRCVAVTCAVLDWSLEFRYSWFPRPSGFTPGVPSDRVAKREPHFFFFEADHCYLRSKGGPREWRLSGIHKALNLSSTILLSLEKLLRMVLFYFWCRLLLHTR